MNRIEIDVGASGTGTFKIDGKEVSATIGGFNIRSRPGKLTTVTVQFVADVEIKADAALLPTEFAEKMA